MRSNRTTPYPLQRKPNKRQLIGETPEEEAARLALEIAAHPVTKCEPGQRGPSLSRPGWSSKPIMSQKDAREAESIAKRMMRKS
ncbi:hypothetical protein [Methyloceanibacter sp.]|uniref:hypothetical protein n=1 Tax=Methyloceanibacter sp. TaxID=1965321 RepID=UPI002D37FF15|nr:hypothetical protein [Methyloceanibacter sp.]HZP10401.1 hypothetical protein [Methyloceanibacter sp.]